MTVIPVDQATWSTLVMLRDSIGFMKEKDRTKYSLAIDKEEDCISI